MSAGQLELIFYVRTSVGNASEEPHLDLTKTQLLFRQYDVNFSSPPLNISISTCPHYTNDEDLNIWEESEADKPFGKHQVRSQGLIALL